MTPNTFGLERVLAYLSLEGADEKIKGMLGGGTDGNVYKTSRETAVKVFLHDGGYFNERDSYARLASFGITDKLGQFWVPKMHGFNDDLMVVEMDIMHQPPYVIDFAKVMIDRDPEFSEDTLATQDEHGWRDFEHNWPAVKVLMHDWRATRFTT